MTRLGVNRVLARLVVLLLAAPVLAMTTASPASACSCAGDPLTVGVERADAVFTGEVLRREESRGRLFASSPTASYVVRVERVFKGEVLREQQVVTPASTASCGLALPASGPALFLTQLPADGDPGLLSATLCGGTRAGSDVPSALGTGTAPLAPDPALPAAAPPKSTRTGATAVWYGVVDLVLVGFAIARTGRR